MGTDQDVDARLSSASGAGPEVSLGLLCQLSGRRAAQGVSTGIHACLRASKVCDLGDLPGKLLLVAMEPHTRLAKTLRLKRKTDGNWRSGGYSELLLSSRPAHLSGLG